MAKKIKKYGKTGKDYRIEEQKMTTITTDVNTDVLKNQIADLKDQKSKLKLKESLIKTQLKEKKDLLKELKKVK